LTVSVGRSEAHRQRGSCQRSPDGGRGRSVRAIWWWCLVLASAGFVVGLVLSPCLQKWWPSPLPPLTWGSTH